MIYWGLRRRGKSNRSLGARSCARYSFCTTKRTRLMMSCNVVHTKSSPCKTTCHSSSSISYSIKTATRVKVPIVQDVSLTFNNPIEREPGHSQTTPWALRSEKSNSQKNNSICQARIAQLNFKAASNHFNIAMKTKMCQLKEMVKQKFFNKN